MKRAIIIIFTLAWSLAGAVALSAQPTTAESEPDQAKPENPIALVSLSTGLNLSPVKELVSGGEIDWTAGVVYAVGHAKARGHSARPRAMARRGAYLVAARNAALVLAGIPVGPGGKFRNIQDGRIRMSVKLRNFRELPGSYDPATRRAEARLEIPIFGISGIVEKLELQAKPVSGRWIWPGQKDVDEETQSDVIVIDARGTGFSPCLLPNIVTPDGKSVFGADDVSAADLVSRPLVRYAAVPKREVIPAESIRKYRRITFRSFTLRPLKNHPAKRGEIVLSHQDLEILELHPEAETLLKNGKVVIITEEE